MLKKPAFAKTLSADVILRVEVNPWLVSALQVCARFSESQIQCLNYDNVGINKFHSVSVFLLLMSACIAFMKENFDLSLFQAHLMQRKGHGREGRSAGIKKFTEKFLFVPKTPGKSNLPRPLNHPLEPKFHLSVVILEWL